MATARMALKKTKEETLGIDKIYLKEGPPNRKIGLEPLFYYFILL
jgi:hypothetical protein